jgi:hypothetical protein
MRCIPRVAHHLRLSSLLWSFTTVDRRCSTIVWCQVFQFDCQWQLHHRHRSVIRCFLKTEGAKLRVGLSAGPWLIDQIVRARVCPALLTTFDIVHHLLYIQRVDQRDTPISACKLDSLSMPLRAYRILSRQASPPPPQHHP